MIVRSDEFLQTLEEKAHAAQRAEIDFRNNVGREIEKRERERQYAFRRLSIAKLMADVARGANDEQKAVADQTAAFRNEFGWHGDSEQTKRIAAAWQPIAVAIWAKVKPASTEAEVADTPADDPSPDVIAAMTSFETWYTAEFGTNYLAILDQEMQELPVVEF